ncbi:unnamed protein product, partial [Staurois parvus]
VAVAPITTLCHGPLYRLSHTAARSILCHVCLCRLLTLLLGSSFKPRPVGLCLASEYCCIHRHPAPCVSVVCSRC